MPRNPNPKPDDPKQAARFIEAAKLLEADKTGKPFEKALDAVGLVARPRPHSSRKLRKN